MLAVCSAREKEKERKRNRLEMEFTDWKKIRYQVPETWYEDIYRDRVECRSGARSFSMVHETKAEECWLLIHGYRGYPGEMVRPAVDLYEAGFDIYVPRIPGHGTCGRDFIRTHRRDWVHLVENALNDLKQQYQTVHLLGHSMGTSIAALLGCEDPQVGKIVYVSPSFENLEMKQPARLILAVLSVFTPKVRCKWHLSTKYHQHYENAPCDEAYLGEEYWKWFFTKQLLEYYRLMKDGLQKVHEYPHEHLIINPLKDHVISEPSVRLFREAVSGKANVADIENGTHTVLYDKDPEAEEAAVRAIMEFAGRLE